MDDHPFSFSPSNEFLLSKESSFIIRSLHLEFSTNFISFNPTGRNAAGALWSVVHQSRAEDCSA
jgi:hypothetical protein